MNSVNHLRKNSKIFKMVAWGGFIPSLLIEKRFEPSISSDNRVQTVIHIWLRKPAPYPGWTTRP